MFIKRIKDLTCGYRKIFLFAGVSAVAAVFASTINPMIIRIVIDSVLGGEPINQGWVGRFAENQFGLDFLRANLWVFCVAVLAVTFFNSISAFGRTYFAANGAEKMAQRLKDRLYDHIQKLPYNEHVKAQAGDWIQRCTSDVDTIRRFFSAQLMEIVRVVFILFFAIPIMFSVNVKLAVVGIAILPVIFVTSFLFFIKIKSTFKKADEKEGELSTVIQENLSGVRVVRAFGRQNFEMEKFEEKNSEYRNLVRKLITVLARFWSTSDILCFIQIGTVLIYSVYLTVKGEATVGTMILFNSYENMLIWPVRHLGRILSDLGKMQISLGRVYEVLDNPEEKGLEGLEPELSADIEFNDVSFEYDGGKKILDHFSVKIKKGQTVAVLGSTGSGKSTLMHLLLRLYDYNSGSIKIGGVELNTIGKRHLRDNIGIVLQEPFLFSKTVRENIKMSKFDATEQEILDITDAAAIRDDITKFEKGFDTIVGEKGITLSGGQKQRVAIARTLIRNSSILIFDDSLSAVDTETDMKIRQALDKREKGITTFIISQRITTLMNADKIFVIEAGRLTDQGTHAELISREGLYSRIWNIQSMLEDDLQEELA